MSLNASGAESSNMGELHEKIADGEYSINVRDTPMGRLVTLNKGDDRTLTQAEHDELKSLLDEFEETIVDLWDIYTEENDKYLARWEMGRIYVEEVDDEEGKNKLRKLAPLLPFSRSREERKAYRYRLFYEFFPDKQWSEKEAPGTYSELAQRMNSLGGTPADAREIYDEHIRDWDETLVRDEVRAWQKAKKVSDSPNRYEIAESVADAVTNPSPKNVKAVYRLLGQHEYPSDDEIEAALRKVQ